MKIKKVALYYFTGTGNTLLVVKKMEKIFRYLNVEVTLFNIAKAEPENIPLNCTVGIAFPVACFSTYPLVWDFLRKMPDGKGTELFMVDTLSSFSGVLTGQVRRLIINKNYSPLGASEIIMPNNINFKKYNEVKTQEKIRKGLEKAKYFAHDLVYGNSKWKPIPLLPTVVNKMKLQNKAWSFLAKRWMFSVDNIRCIRCGICYKLCPVDNIEMENYPEYLDRCQFCLRCISFCPTGAISFKDKGVFYPYTAVEYEDLLK